MAKSCLRWLKLLKISKNGLTWIEMARVAGYGWICLKMAENGWKCLEMAGMAGYCWKWMLKAGHGLKFNGLITVLGIWVKHNQVSWSSHLKYIFQNLKSTFFIKRYWSA